MKNLRSTTTSVTTLRQAAFGLSLFIGACTPSTPDYVPLPATGSSTSTGVGSSSAASSAANAGATSGSTATGVEQEGSSSGAGSSAPTTGDDSDAGAGAGGDATTGSPSGDAGPTTGATPPGADGGGTTATTPSGDGGCYWIQNAAGTWMFDPVASEPDKQVLFDGGTLAEWHKENEPTTPIQWTLNADGTMTVVPSGTGMATLIQSNHKYSDLCIHVEYLTPMYPSDVTGQQRGNSGVYAKSAYEMQILDSYGDPPDINTCGAVYSIAKPLVVACNMQLVWNTYEIEFKGSVWNTANPPVKTQDAEYVKCALNGQIVQENIDLDPAAGYTPAGIPDAPGPQPLGLQDHLCYVSFRNVWVRVPQY